MIVVMVLMAAMVMTAMMMQMMMTITLKIIKLYVHIKWMVMIKMLMRITTMNEKIGKAKGYIALEVSPIVITKLNIYLSLNLVLAVGQLCQSVDRVKMQYGS